MIRFSKIALLLSGLLVLALVSSLKYVNARNSPAAGKEVVLKASEITSKIFPERVFFRGQTAPTQLRNSGGVHFADDLYVLAGLVDSSGYSTGLREKYQAYLLSEVTFEIDGQSLKPGAYGFGFLEGGKFIVMDLGANDVLQAKSQRAADLKRPIPFQVVASATAGNYRLYAGRVFVEFHRAG
jgi:hypothetical protein